MDAVANTRTAATGVAAVGDRPTVSVSQLVLQANMNEFCTDIYFLFC